VLIHVFKVSVSAPSDCVLLLSLGLRGGWTKPGVWLEPVKEPRLVQYVLSGTMVVACLRSGAVGVPDP